MKVLVFGKTGQVATQLQRLAKVTALGRNEADLSDPETCANIIAHTDANVIINAAAYTAVDLAEKEELLAACINGDAPTQMARAAAVRGIPFLHISTDYVFGGAGDQARTELAEPKPANVYGRSKLQGEVGIACAGGPFAILRTSWVFSAHGANFVKTMLRLGRERGALRIVNNQIGGPTPAADIAAALLAIATAFHAGEGKSGVYHFSGTPDVSWEGFAREIFSLANLNVDVSGIPGSVYPTPATRPLNSRLDCNLILQTFSIARPDWQRGLQNVLRELGELP